MPTPNTPIWKGPKNLLIEVPESGRIESSDRVRRTRVYRGCTEYPIIIPNRGTLGTGDNAGWVVASATYEPDRGRVYKYTINWEAGGPECGLTPPSSEIDMQPVELYPAVERNKFFAGINQKTLALAYAVKEASTPMARAAASSSLSGLGDSTQRTLGLALAAKLLSGIETTYQAGWRYTATLYSYGVPSTTIGGYIQAPTIQPSTGYFSGSLSWLRLADALSSVGPLGSMWKVVRTYLGGPGGYWDTDLYS